VESTKVGGLRGEGIPLSARIVRLVDVFDALLSERPYKPAWDLERCLEEIARNAGRQFDPELVPIFLAMIERTPLDVPIARPAIERPFLRESQRSRRRPAGTIV
jgi:HD-GYP domain-containing protein (c-di-GMP phosphodiesterase class II)